MHPSSIPLEIWLDILWDVAPSNILSLFLLNKEWNEFMTTASDKIFGHILIRYMPETFTCSSSLDSFKSLQKPHQSSQSSVEGDLFNLNLGQNSSVKPGTGSTRHRAAEIAQQIINGDVSATNAFSDYWHNVSSIQDLCMRSYHLQVSWEKPSKWGTFGFLGVETMEGKIYCPSTPYSFVITKGLFIQPVDTYGLEGHQIDARDPNIQFLTIDLCSAEVSDTTGSDKKPPSGISIQAHGKTLFTDSFRTIRRPQIYSIKEPWDNTSERIQLIRTLTDLHPQYGKCRLKENALACADWDRYCLYDVSPSSTNHKVERLQMRMDPTTEAIELTDLEYREIKQVQQYTYADSMDFNCKYAAVLSENGLIVIPHSVDKHIQEYSCNELFNFGPSTLFMKIFYLTDDDKDLASATFLLREYELYTKGDDYKYFPDMDDQEWQTCNTSHEGNVMVFASRHSVHIILDAQDLWTSAGTQGLALHTLDRKQIAQTCFVTTIVIAEHERRKWYESPDDQHMKFQNGRIICSNTSVPPLRYTLYCLTSLTSLRETFIIDTRRFQLDREPGSLVVTSILTNEIRECPVRDIQVLDDAIFISSYREQDARFAHKSELCRAEYKAGLHFLDLRPKMYRQIGPKIQWKSL